MREDSSGSTIRSERLFFDTLPPTIYDVPGNRHLRKFLERALRGRDILCIRDATLKEGRGARWRKTCNAQCLRLYFVSNSAKAAENFDAIVRVEEDRTPEFWHPDTGRIVTCRSFVRVEGGCRLTLELPAYGSVFVVFRRTPTPAAYLSPEPLKAEDRPAVAVAGPWTVRFPPGWGATGSVLWNGLISWTESEDPGVRHFSGTASYTAEFEFGEPLLREGPGWLLDLGSLREVAEVTLNGRNLGILWKEPFQADVSGLLRSGRNVLEDKVTKLWKNRLMGDSWIRAKNRTRIAVQRLERPGGDCSRNEQQHGQRDEQPSLQRWGRARHDPSRVIR